MGCLGVAKLIHELTFTSLIDHHLLNPEVRCEETVLAGETKACSFFRVDYSNLFFLFFLLSIALFFWVTAIECAIIVQCCRLVLAGNVIVDSSANITFSNTRIVVFFKFQSDVASCIINRFYFENSSKTIGTPLFTFCDCNAVEAKLWG